MIINCPSVLIIILNYGTYELTISLINEIHKNLDYSNYSVLVVDNCSPNESSKVLQEKSTEMNFKFISNTINSGYAAGNNIGIRYAIDKGYDYSWILNNDIELRENNVLSHMVHVAESNKKVGCVGPMIYCLDGTICPPYCRRPNVWRMTLGIVFEKKYRKKHNLISGEVYRVYGCCMLLRNSTMTIVDCLDERTFLYCEEDILAERMLKYGFVSFYDADISVTHKESSSLKKMSSNRKKMQIKETNKSMELYLKEYRHFNCFTRFLCRCFRSMIIWIR